MEELLLEAFLALDELDVIEQQNIDLSVALLEFAVVFCRMASTY